jgi:thiamine biosynthesis lipoprotein ApbE
MYSRISSILVSDSLRSVTADASSMMAWSRGSTVIAVLQFLLVFASRCYELSDSLFDITSKMVRRVWKFDASDRIPDNTAIEELLALVVFNKLRSQSPSLLLLAEMELDFGGIGTEYAVDREYDLAVARRARPFLINFSGALRVDRSPLHPKATTLGGFGALWDTVWQAPQLMCACARTFTGCPIQLRAAR